MAEQRQEATARKTAAASAAAAARPSQDASKAELLSGSSVAAAGAAGGAGAGAGVTAKSGSVKDALERTHAKVAERGERLGRLDDKAEQMAKDAEKFEDSAAALAEKFRKQNSGWGFW